MTLQNRVNPWGEIEAVAVRGAMMGNRGGKFHRPGRTLGKRRWASHHWICCDIDYKGMRHEAMGEGYTSLFFLDEVTALAAGHRPCFFCRREEAKRFLGNRRVDEFDRQLHQERLNKPLPWERSAAQRMGEGTPIAGLARDPLIPPLPFGNGSPLLPLGEGNLPTGAMVEIDGLAYAVKSGVLLPWSHFGYGPAIPRNAAPSALLLTPPSITAILAGGYQPRWHQSALTGDWT